MTERRKRPSIDEIMAIMEKDKEERKTSIFHLMSTNPMLDEDGYPTQAALDIVEMWHWSDPKGWFKFIESLWAMKYFGWAEGETPHDWKPNTVTYIYEISTAGWSGNEAIIRAMQENVDSWEFNWVQSRRGGHYIFELRDYGEDDVCEGP